MVFNLTFAFQNNCEKSTNTPQIGGIVARGQWKPGGRCAACTATLKLS